MLKATIRTTKKPEGSTTYDEITIHAEDHASLDRQFAGLVERYTDEYAFEIAHVEEQSLAGILGF